MLGIYISGHPLEKYREQIAKQTNINTLQIREAQELSAETIDNPELLDNRGNSRLVQDGQFVKYAGIITSVKKKYTKNNKIMAFVTIEDLYGTAEIICFENSYRKAGESLVEENIVIVDGRLSIREDENATIIANDIRNFVEQKQKILTLDITNCNEIQKEKLRGAIRFFNGDRNNINVQIKVGEELKPCGQIYLTDDIFLVFKQIVGDNKAYII